MSLILGIDIGGTDTKLGIITPDGDIVERDRIPTRAEEGPEAVARRVQGWLDEREEKHHHITVAGVGCAGLVDGVLTVTIPKAEVAKPKQITVK